MTPKQIKERLTGNDRAVSPVIGVILMVAITVILAAVIGTFVLDLGQSAGNSAPSASLSVNADSSNEGFNVSHKGGDGLDSTQTRVVITNESNGNAVTFESTSSSSVLSVGGQVNFNVDTTPHVTSSTWSSMGTSGTSFAVAQGEQYSVQIIDTESQRVIYETTITA